MVNPRTPTLLRVLLGRRLSAIALHAPATLYSNLAYRLRGWKGVPYRLAYYFVGSWLRRRDPVPVQRVRLSADTTADVARHLSALLMSNSVCDIDVEFGEADAGELHAPADLSHHAFDHNVNRFLKVAHPGAVVVAVSLAESPDGFCDQAFAAWRSALAGLAADTPGIALVLLNPIGPALCRAEFVARRGPVFSARLAGLSQAEVVRLAQTADAFIGPLDTYGLAARAAGRPGVYLEAGQPPQVAVQKLHDYLDASRNN